MNDLKAIAFLAGLAAIATVVTWIVARALGRWAARHAVLTHAVSILAVPTVVLAIGITFYWIDSTRHPESDMPPMALAGWMMFAFLTLLVTIPVAIVTLQRARLRSAAGGSR